jgi:hypothetical protein
MIYSTKGLKSKSSCPKCENLPKHKQCRQRLDVKVKKVDAKYIGYGISRADSINHPQPIPVSISTFLYPGFLAEII